MEVMGAGLDSERIVGSVYRAGMEHAKKKSTHRRGRVPSLSALTVFGVIARAEQVHNDCTQPLFPTENPNPKQKGP
jgi:hypothetical protein